jgi:hypothetical protein
MKNVMTPTPQPVNIRYVLMTRNAVEIIVT